MSIITSETKQRIDAAIIEGKRFSDNLEQSGLDMDTEVMLVRKKMDDLRAGQFKTLVMGKFKTGKSTLINCIVGKEMMAAKAAACTALSAVVEHGDNTDQAKLVFTDGHEEYMPLEQFSKEYQLSDEDYDSLESGIHPNRFADISHVVMYSNNKLFSDGFQLIDSPGWDMDNTPTQATYKYLLQADAIVFMLSAVSLFSEREREFIAETFANKGCRNLFFVVNRINQVAPIDLAESYVKPAVKNGLKKVFTDKNGVFDEELYNKRVFFVDAYSGYCARTGQPTTIMVGKRVINVDCDIQDTGIPEFEEALREFLNSEDRIRLTIASLLNLMKSIYQKACRQMELDQATHAQSKAQQYANFQLAARYLDQAEVVMEEIEARTKFEIRKVAELLNEDLLRFVEKDISEGFAAYITENGEIAKHIKRLNPAQLAAIRVMANLPMDWLESRLVHQYDRLISPVAAEINHYIENQLRAWDKRAPAIYSNSLEAYQREIEKEMRHYTMNLNEARKVFAYGDAASTPEIEVNQYFKGDLDIRFIDDDLLNPAQPLKALPIIMSLCSADVSMGVIYTVPRLAHALAVNAISAILQVPDASELIRDMGNEAFKGLSAHVRRSGVGIREKVEKQFYQELVPLLETARRAITNTRNHMERILADDNRSLAEIEAEYHRKDDCLRRMEKSIHGVRTIIRE